MATLDEVLALLKAAGVTITEPEPVAPVVSAPVTATAAQPSADTLSFLSELGLQRRVNENPYTPVGCYDGACNEKFRPHGTGSVLHSSCSGPNVRAMTYSWNAAKRRKLPDTVAAIEAKALQMVAAKAEAPAN